MSACEQTDARFEQYNTTFHATRAFVRCENYRVRLKGVFIEKDSKVRIAGAHKELLRDVRDVITGFLKNNCMILTTGSGVGFLRAWPGFH